MSRQHHHALRGLSLFEVLLSLAIFAVALAAVGQAIANGSRAATRCRLQTQATLRCQSKLAELMSGAEPLTPTENAPFDDDRDWRWSLDVDESGTDHLARLRLTVQRLGRTRASAASFTLTQLIRDPKRLRTANRLARPRFETTELDVNRESTRP